jgi:hypothetical protein
MGRTRAYVGAGTLTGWGLDVTVHYRVTRTSRDREGGRRFGGAGRILGGPPEEITVALLDLPVQTVSALGNQCGRRNNLCNWISR